MQQQQESSSQREEATRYANRIQILCPRGNSDEISARTIRSVGGERESDVCRCADCGATFSIKPDC